MNKEKLRAYLEAEFRSLLLLMGTVQFFELSKQRPSDFVQDRINDNRDLLKKLDAGEFE